MAGTLAPSELGDRPVETVKQGQRLFGYDLVSGQWRLCTVLDVFESDFAGDSVEISGAFGRIESTQHHPFWVVEGEDLEERSKPDHLASGEESYPSIPGRWVDAHELRVGDVLFLRGGRRAAIESIACRPVAARVYNFRVDGLHNYAVGAGGVLVHNGCKGGSLPNKIGQAGEKKAVKKAGMVKNDEGIVMASGRVRKPDGLDWVGQKLTEVKNVAYQHLSTQLKDYLAFAQRNNLQMVLIVRKATKVVKETKLSKPLQELVDSGMIDLLRIL